MKFIAIRKNFLKAVPHLRQHDRLFDQFMAEGQLKETMAQKHVAFAALPDGASAICLQYARALNRTFVATLRGVLWNVPNDIFNGRQRLLAHENGADYLRGGDYAKRYEQIDAGHWVNVDGKIGLASPQKLTIVRPGRRQVEILGRENSGTLYAEEICAPYSTKRRFYDRNETLIDVGFGMTLGDACATRALSDSLATSRKGDLFAITATGQDGRRYTMLANFGDGTVEIDLDAWNWARLALMVKNRRTRNSLCPAMKRCSYFKGEHCDEQDFSIGLGDATAVEHLEGGVTRKILKYGGKLMLVEVTMPKGGTGSAHKHPHEQISYIARGSFEFTVGAEKQVVKAGDSLYVASNVEHGTRSLEDGSIVVDIFTPIREDFLAK